MKEQLMIEQEEGPTRKVKKSNKAVSVLATATLVVMCIAGTLGFAWADTGNDNSATTIKATDAIKSNPTAMTILENIELFKKTYALQQQGQQLQDQQSQFIEQQRARAQAYLQSDLAQLSTKDQTAPQAAFTSFASTINSPAQNVFLDEFKYMEAKVQEARNVQSQVLQDGGSLDQALQAFNTAATFHKTEIVKVNNDLNVKYSLAEQKVQSLFDQWGDMPRN